MRVGSARPLRVLQAERPPATGGLEGPEPVRTTPTQATALVSAGHGVHDAYTAILPALLPLLQARFALTETLLALLVAAFSFSSSFPAPLLGALADRLGPRLMTALGIALTAVLLSLVGIASSFAMLLVLVVVAGLGSAALHPAGSLLARGPATLKADVAVALFSAGGMIGYAVGPVVVLFVVARFGLEATPWLLVPGIVVAGLVYALLPRGRTPMRQRGGVLRLDPELVSGPVGLLTLAGTLSYLPFLAFVSAVPLWLVQIQGLPADDPWIGLTLTVFSLAAAAGGVTAGLMSVWFRRDRLVAALMVLAVGPLFAVFYTQPGSAAYIAAVAMAGALSYASAPLLVVSAQDLAPRAAAAASGMLIGLAAGFAALLYVAVGWLQEVIGLGPALAGSYLALLPAAALAHRVLRAHPTPPRPATSGALQEMACACLAAGPLGLRGAQSQPMEHEAR